MLALEGPEPCRLLTGDVDRTAAFWQRALQLTVGRRQPDRIELVDGGHRVRVIVGRVMPPRPRIRVRLTAFDSQDVTAAVERLIALGASTPRPPYPAVPGRAVVVDPDGNTIEITAAVDTPI